MRTASILLQTLALGILFAVHIAGPTDARMPGVRRALQTMAAEQTQLMTGPVVDSMPCE